MQSPKFDFTRYSQTIIFNWTRTQNHLVLKRTLNSQLFSKLVMTLDQEHLDLYQNISRWD